MTRRTTTYLVVFGIALIGGAFGLYLRSDAYCATDRNCRQLLHLETAVIVYRLDSGVLPAELKELLQQHPHWDRPYLSSASMLFDQWGHPIVYRHADGSLGSFSLTILASKGQADGIGPAEDIVRKYP
jgi:hypothetical protein